jgi:sigma-B regulation protein RsbU (phosphoserine phosphatase)
MIISEQRSRMFATTFVAYIDPANGQMTFASGGHNPALLYRAETRQCEYLTAPGVAVGIFREAEFVPQEVTLAVGDVLVLYTDGITEAINDDEDEFGEERLEQVVIRHADQAAQDIADLILDEVNVFTGDQSLFDDATVVVIKRLGPKP